MADPSVDLTTLTEQQQEALQLFTSVTDQDLSTAVPLLQKCQWNAQIAITRFFDGDAETVDPVAEAERAPPPPQDSRRTETLMDNFPARQSRTRANRGLEPAPRVVPTPENQLTQPLPFPFNIILLPFNITYTIISRILGTMGYLFPIFPRLLSRLYGGRANPPSRDAGRRPLNPRDTAARFIREFEEEYGVTHNTLPFHEQGYAHAFDAAKRDLKYLLVVFFSPEHDDTAPFVRSTLLSPDVVQFLSHPPSPLLLWAGSVRDPEAYQVATALNITRFPAATLIVHTPSVSSTSMSKIASITGPISPQDLLAKLTSAMQAHDADLDRHRRTREEQNATRNLRQEQESAYERSLAQDREKTRKRKEEAEAKEKADREIRERAEQKADKARKLAQWRRWRAGRIAAEPSAEEKDVVRISVRMPDGARVVRRFLPEVDLEELYAFVECYSVLEERAQAEAVVEEKAAEEPEDYMHEYGFVLVSPLPREVLGLEKGGALRQRVGRSGNLIVESIQDEDEDDDDDIEESD